MNIPFKINRQVESKVWSMIRGRGRWPRYLDGVPVYRNVTTSVSRQMLWQIKARVLRKYIDESF